VFLRDISTVLIASVALSIIWELRQKRDFVQEVLSVQDLVKEIDETGLIGISSKWHGEVDWRRLLRTANELDIFHIYGKTWFSTNHEALSEFISRSNGGMNVVLPDPENNLAMDYLVYRMKFLTKKSFENALMRLLMCTKKFSRD
jgi:hypothetical protein